ncbi:hypothetical protein [Streptomyces sp. NPDC007083]|uniref:hypothetical protein n=1 Tax=Streptomyces sp. NPDC007083 TaxID=3156913 RepID=UPI0033DBF3F4
MKHSGSAPRLIPPDGHGDRDGGQPEHDPPDDVDEAANPHLLADVDLSGRAHGIEKCFTGLLVQPAPLRDPLIDLFHSGAPRIVGSEILAHEGEYPWKHRDYIIQFRQPQQNIVCGVEVNLPHDDMGGVLVPARMAL